MNKRDVLKSLPVKVGWPCKEQLKPIKGALKGGPFHHDGIWAGHRSARLGANCILLRAAQSEFGPW